MHRCTRRCVFVGSWLCVRKLVAAMWAAVLAAATVAACWFAKRCLLCSSGVGGVRKAQQLDVCVCVCVLYAP